MQLPDDWGRGEILRNRDAGNLLESFLVCAILSMLVIRAYLRLTGYPQIGGRGLHIAHMLWGGALMITALFILLACLGQHARRGAAVVAGIGFGFFIDELGKFITRDNNYFFRPTFGIVYLIFVTLYLVARAIVRLRPLSPREYFANAVDMVIDMLHHGATPEEATRALALLEASGVDAAVMAGLRTTILAAAERWYATPSRIARIEGAIRGCYRRCTRARWFHWIARIVFVANALAALLLSLTPVLRLGERATRLDTRSYTALANLIASTVAGIMILVGALQWNRSRQVALRWFKRAMLVSIFVVQPYAFFDDQLRALGGLFVDLVLLFSVNYLLRALAAHALPVPGDQVGAKPAERGMARV